MAAPSPSVNWTELVRLIRSTSQFQYLQRFTTWQKEISGRELKEAKGRWQHYPFPDWLVYFTVRWPAYCAHFNLEGCYFTDDVQEHWDHLCLLCSKATHGYPAVDEVGNYKCRIMKEYLSEAMQLYARQGLLPPTDLSQFLDVLAASVRPDASSFALSSTLSPMKSVAQQREAVLVTPESLFPSCIDQPCLEPHPAVCHLGQREQSNGSAS